MSSEKLDNTNYWRQVKYGSQYMVKWLFKQDEVWLTAKGEWKAIPLMTKEHALNTMLFLERTAFDVWEAAGNYTQPDKSEVHDWLANTPLYRALRKRVLRNDIVVSSTESQAQAPVAGRWSGPRRHSWADPK